MIIQLLKSSVIVLVELEHLVQLCKVSRPPFTLANTEDINKECEDQSTSQ